MKRLIVSMLVAVMVTAFGATSFAAATTVSSPAFSDIAGHEAEFELTVMKALGIMTGDAGTTIVRPNDTITRAEVSKVLVVMLGRDAIAAGMAGVRPSFTDEVPTWAWGYVNCAQVMGLIQGYDDSTFKADHPVTYAEVVTMLVRAISGHKEQVVPGFWPYNFLFHGIDYGFTGDVDLSFSGLPCPRGDVARLAFATMRVDKLVLGGPNAGETIPNSAILAGDGAGQLGFVYTGVVNTYDLANNSLTFNPTKDLAASVYLVGASTFEDLMNLSIIAVAGKTDKILVIGRTQDVQTYSGLYAGLDTSVPTAHKLVFADGTKIPLPHDALGDPIFVPARINNLLTTVDVLWTHNLVGAECAVSLDGAGKAKFVNALYWEWLDYITEFVKSVGGATPVDASFTYGLHPWWNDSVPASCRVTINGTLAGRDDLRDWDVAWFAYDWDSGALLAIKATRRVVEGKPSGIHTTYGADGIKHYASFGGTQYFTGLRTVTWYPGTVHEHAETYGLGPLNPGTTYRVGLDESGMAFVQIEEEPATPIVVLREFSSFGDGTGSAKVDVRGAAATYAVGADEELQEFLAAWTELGLPFWMQVDWLNTIVDVGIAFPEGDPPATFRVLANDGGNLTLENADTGEIGFIPAADAITVYRLENFDVDDLPLEFTYVAAASIPVGTDFFLVPCAFGTSEGFDGTVDDLSHLKLFWLISDEIMEDLLAGPT